MKYPLHLQEIELPNGPFGLLMPEPAIVASAFRQQQAENRAGPFPYWVRLWPSAIALAGFIQQHPQYVKDRSVAELAAGLGLPSLVSATIAQVVWCSDLAAEAAAVAQQSADWHGFTNFETAACHWGQIPPHIQPDVLLLSDVNYEPEVFTQLRLAMEAFLKKGTVILLATPQRLLAKPFIIELLPYALETEEIKVVSGKVTDYISLYVLAGNKRPV